LADEVYIFWEKLGFCQDWAGKVEFKKGGLLCDFGTSCGFCRKNWEIL